MTARDGYGLVEWTWLTAGGERLHHATLTDDQYAELFANGYLKKTRIRLTCGRTLYWPREPSPGTRLSTQRCQGCCSRLHYPWGPGSPLNDDNVRPLVEARIADWPN